MLCPYTCRRVYPSGNARSRLRPRGYIVPDTTPNNEGLHGGQTPPAPEVEARWVARDGLMARAETGERGLTKSKIRREAASGGVIGGETGLHNHGQGLTKYCSARRTRSSESFGASAGID